MAWLLSAQRKGVLTVFQDRFTTYTISSTLELNSNKLTLNSTAVKFNSNGSKKAFFASKSLLFARFGLSANGGFQSVTQRELLLTITRAE